MDLVLMKKAKMIAESKNGDRILDLLHISAYLAPQNIRSCLFSPLFPDTTELKSAIQFLQRLVLVVQASDEASSFSVPKETRVRLRLHLNFLGFEEAVLNGAISLLERSKAVEYAHFQSVYSYAKLYPSIQLGRLAAKTIFGMLREKKFKEACEFGNECKELLVKNLGEYHQSVMDVQSLVANALVALLRRKEAVAVLTDVYQKSCQVLELKEIQPVLLRLAKVVMEDPCDTITSAEARLRKIVFHGKNVSESFDVSDLEIWTIYTQVLVTYGMTGKAVSYMDEIIEKRIGIFGRDDDGILDAMQAKARCLIVQLKILEAMELSRSIFEKRKKKLGLKNSKTLRAKIDIARILLLQGEWEESLMMFEEVAKHAEQTGSDTSNDLYLSCKMDMVGIFRLQRDFQKALELSSQLCDRIVAKHGATHLLSYECKHIMGEILMEMGRFQEARACLEELLEIAPLEAIEILRIQINSIDHNDFFNAPAGSLHWAAKEGQVSNVLSLLETGQDIEAKDSNGMTALHYASAFGQTQVASELILKEAKYNPKTSSNTTPHQIAKGTEMKALLKTVHSFFEAVRDDDMDLVMELLKKEPRVLRARDEHGCNCLHWAALRGHKTLSGVLVELGANSMMVTDRGNSSLHIAASKGHVAIAESLLRYTGLAEGIKMLDGKTTSGGNTPLHAAAEKGFPEMVRFLLAHGAVYGAKNVAGKTPFQLSEDWDCRNLLGLADALFSDVDKGDVLALCAKLRDLESEDVLAMSRAKNEKHRTLLQEAMKLNHVGIAKKLVKLLKYSSAEE